MQLRTGDSKTLFNEAVDSRAANMLALSRQADFSPEIRIFHNGPFQQKQNVLQTLGEIISVVMKEGDASTTYRGVCIGSGRWQETFLLHSEGAAWHERVMKLTRLLRLTHTVEGPEAVTDSTGTIVGIDVDPPKRQRCQSAAAAADSDNEARRSRN